jgi:hypothetical protein
LRFELRISEGVGCGACKMRVGVSECSAVGTRWQTVLVYVADGWWSWCSLAHNCVKGGRCCKTLHSSGYSVHTRSSVLERIGMIKVKEHLCKATKPRCKGRMRTLLPLVVSVARSSVTHFRKTTHAAARRRYVATVHSPCANHLTFISLLHRCGDQYCMYCCRL